MNREGIGQAVAAGSVVLSLLFVGYEIRQNTSVARQEAYYAFMQALNENSYSLAKDSELAGIIARAVDGEPRSDFTSAERLRIEVSWIALLRVWEALDQSRAEGIADDDSYFVNLARGMGPYDNQYFDEWWPTARQTLSDEFAVFFEQQRSGGEAML